MTIRDEAVALDKEAQVLAKRMTSDFIRIGRVMNQMTDERQLWRELKFESQEAWVTSRFRSQRATAFEARRIYRALHATVPEVVLEFIEPGSLKVLAELPESAQRNLEVQQKALTSSVAEFTEAILVQYPNELIEKRIVWTLKPTMSQAQLYDRVLTAVQQSAGLSREDAMEYVLQEVESNMEPKGGGSFMPPNAVTVGE